MGVLRCQPILKRDSKGTILEDRRRDYRTAKTRLATYVTEKEDEKGENLKKRKQALMSELYTVTCVPHEKKGKDAKVTSDDLDRAIGTFFFETATPFAVAD